MMNVKEDTVYSWETLGRSPAIGQWPAIIRFLGYVPFAKGDSFADRLKAYRKLCGLTQQQLADELGVAMLTVRTWEAGTHQPRPETRERVEQLIEFVYRA